MDEAQLQSPAEPAQKMTKENTAGPQDSPAGSQDIGQNTAGPQESQAGSQDTDSQEARAGSPVGSQGDQPEEGGQALASFPVANWHIAGFPSELPEPEVPVATRMAAKAALEAARMAATLIAQEAHGGSKEGQAGEGEDALSSSQPHHTSPRAIVVRKKLGDHMQPMGHGPWTRVHHGIG
jgi:hypothetical protein